MEEKTKEEQKAKKYIFHDTIISWACIIWAIVSIILMLYFSGLNQVTFTIMTLGQLFLILGIIATVRKQSTGPVFTITGLACIILPAINEWGYMFNEAIPAGNNLLPILISTAITLIGLVMLIAPEALEDMASMRCKEVVKAEVIDLKTTILPNEVVAYSPVYSYNYKEKVYTKCTEKYKVTEIPEIGSKTELRINAKKPEEVYFEATKASKMLIYIFGAGFFITGLGMILTVLSI